MLNVQIGKTYTFNTRSAAFLGAKIVRAKLKYFGDADTVRKDFSIDQLFAQIYPTLPAGSPKDVNASVYYVFEAQNGSKIVMAESWIDAASLEVVEHVTISVTIPQASLSDVEAVRIAISAAGIQNFAIEVS